MSSAIVLDARARRVLLCGGLLVTVSLGIRHGFGIFLVPFTVDTQLSRGSFAFAIALQNLVWGFAQPLAGWIAERHGTRRVLAAGALAYGAGLVAAAHATTPLALALGLGVLVGLGLSGTYTVVFGVVARAVPAERRSLALGSLGALASFGQFAMLPFAQALIAQVGWWWALLVLAAQTLLILPLALPLRERPGGPATPHGAGPRPAQVLRSRAFWLLTASFFVCGFQVVFIATHLPAYLLDQGAPLAAGTTALALIGLANIAGSWLAGWGGARWAKHRLLAGLYLARAVVLAAFVLLPVTPATLTAFAVAIGLLWLGTVPLTSGIVADLFGVQSLATIFGGVYVAHQVGAFLGGWAGGLAFDAGGSYAPVWLASIGLSLLAAAASLGAHK